MAFVVVVVVVVVIFVVAWNKHFPGRVVGWSDKVALFVVRIVLASIVDIVFDMIVVVDVVLCDDMDRSKYFPGRVVG